MKKRKNKDKAILLASVTDPLEHMGAQGHFKGEMMNCVLHMLRFLSWCDIRMIISVTSLKLEEWLLNT